MCGCFNIDFKFVVSSDPSMTTSEVAVIIDKRPNNALVGEIKKRVFKYITLMMNEKICTSVLLKRLKEIYSKNH